MVLRIRPEWSRRRWIPPFAHIVAGGRVGVTEEKSLGTVINILVNTNLYQIELTLHSSGNGFP